MPLLLIACGIAAFAVVTLLMNRGGDGSKSAAARSSGSSTSSPSSPPTSASASTSGSAGASTGSTVASSGPTAAFPAGVRTMCGGGTGHENEPSRTLPDNVRVSADDGYIPSCEFVTDVRAWVDEEVSAEPSTRHFERNDTSKRSPVTRYHEVCERANHLTTCRIGGHNYVIYVRDWAN